ncbi:MAG: ABC-F family ATP-binding cassette domain-containing protein [Deltaproteobacteria bacterium]|nr:ABC-F family ATP-binding cassette domain-containing protein [Deltaproteobacteria bacterium]
MLVQLADVSFGHAGDTLFEGLSWQVNPGEHLGLVGPNGCGKSTLLRLLAGELEPEAGQVVRARGLRIGYLHQSQEFSGEGTVRHALMQPFADLLALRAELDELTALLAAAEDAAVVSRYGRREEEYRQRGGYSLEARIRELGADVGFSERDLDRRVDTLSGGERNQLELAVVLLGGADLLLLDEPTNHLDATACERLEEFLAGYPGAFVLVSHDRYLLDKVARRIVELDDGLDEYAAGWDAYIVEREKRRELRLKAFERQQEEIARQEDFIRRNLAGQKTNQAKSRRKMLERIERLEWHHSVWDAAGRIGLRFDPGDRPGGKEAFTTERLTVGYEPARPFCRDLDLTIYRGDRVGIVGRNGCGKTTLLKTLLGKVRPLAGNVRRGHEIKVGAFDQKLSDLDEERSLVEEIRSVRGDLSPDAVRNYLARFRFFGDDVFRTVKGLSGGERNRLSLGKMMLRPANVLALDEPTNHLDIPAREVLEQALRGFEGTILVVSHDRYFLDQVCTRLLVMEEGQVLQETGNYSDLRWRRSERPAPPPPDEAPPPTGARPGDRSAAALDYERRKAERNERERRERRLRALEEEIAGLEARLTEVRARLASDHGGDWQKLHALVEEERALDESLTAKLAEWEQLGAEVEG